MKRHSIQLNILLMILIFAASECCAQNPVISYFRNEEMTLSAPKEKAEYVQIRSTDADGNRTTSLTKVKDGSIVREEHYHQDEPTGKWTIKKVGRTLNLDYDFPLRYWVVGTKRPDSATFAFWGQKNVNLLENRDSIAYRAPRLATGDASIGAFVQRNIAYPNEALRNEISGTVYVTFVILEDGTVDDVAILRKLNPLLDKEAFRLVRLLKFANGASLDGKGRKLALTLPIGFRIE